MSKYVDKSKGYEVRQNLELCMPKPEFEGQLEWYQDEETGIFRRRYIFYGDKINKKTLLIKKIERIIHNEVNRLKKENIMKGQEIGQLNKIQINSIPSSILGSQDIQIYTKNPSSSFSSYSSIISLMNRALKNILIKHDAKYYKLINIHNFPKTIKEDTQIITNSRAPIISAEKKHFIDLVPHESTLKNFIRSR